MIIMKIQGGLGNQLFQYATGRRVAMDRQAPLKLDLSWYWQNQARLCSLLCFNICAEEASAEDIAMTRGKRRDKETHQLKLAKPYYHRPWIRQRGRKFDANILDIQIPVYLDGYWQSEKYFATIEPVLRQELTVTVPPDAQNQAMAHKICQHNAISIHLRRGDFVSSPQASKRHGTCSLAYYRRAIDTLAELVDAPHFFVFSDDMAWVQENLVSDYPTTYVAHNGWGKDFEDLRLMSLCQHHIIANSTFSWWGAWLGANPQKIVIAPQTWLTDPYHDSRYIIPATWLQLP
jgi:hypothetical protein